MNNRQIRTHESEINAIVVRRHAKQAISVRHNKLCVDRTTATIRTRTRTRTKMKIMLVMWMQIWIMHKIIISVVHHSFAPVALVEPMKWRQIIFNPFVHRLHHCYNNFSFNNKFNKKGKRNRITIILLIKIITIIILMRTSWCEIWKGKTRITDAVMITFEMRCSGLIGASCPCMTSYQTQPPQEISPAPPTPPLSDVIASTIIRMIKIISKMETKTVLLIEVKVKIV